MLPKKRILVLVTQIESTYCASIVPGSSLCAKEPGLWHLCTYTHDTVHERARGGSATCIFPIRMSQTKGDVVDASVTNLRIFWRRPGWQSRVAGRPYPSNVYTQNNNKNINVRSLNIMFLPGCRLRFIWNQHVTSGAYHISFLVKLDILIEMESIFFITLSGKTNLKMVWFTLTAQKSWLTDTQTNRPIA